MRRTYGRKNAAAIIKAGLVDIIFIQFKRNALNFIWDTNLGNNQWE